MPSVLLLMPYLVVLVSILAEVLVVGTEVLVVALEELLALVLLLALLVGGLQGPIVIAFLGICRHLVLLLPGGTVVGAGPVRVESKLLSV